MTHSVGSGKKSCSEHFQNISNIYPIAAVCLLKDFLPVPATQKETLLLLFERVCEIRHTWKLKMTQSVAPRNKIYRNFQKISNFCPLI